ncbi:hypothetical protein ACHHYP_03288 [Achlya hypogyna]|uniref:Uncharacterized protein n=1 Tax=Achlya hypogyna TaxID=1202772 RepID=A0A1V9ZRG4_ACHHY|nr:hypothetical protein ACHHYP_03288 [Achlya hypogyna]
MDHRDLFADLKLDLPPVPTNMHVAVARPFAQTFGSPTSVADDAPSIVCLGCYSHGTKHMRDLCTRQAFLTQDLLTYHHLDATTDSELPVQLVMTNVVPWGHGDEYKALVQQSSCEVEGIFGGSVRSYMDGSLSGCKSAFFGGIVFHFPTLQACISWLCCAQNAELKLGCPSITSQKATFTLLPLPLETPCPFDPFEGADSPTSSDEVCTISFEECIEYALLDITCDSDTEPESPNSLWNFDTDATSSNEPSLPSSPSPAEAPLVEQATFVDGHGVPLAFKALYYRNNKKGGIRNLRCFPQCKRGAHTTTSFCGDLLRVQVYFSAEARPRVLGFARFRSAMDHTPALRVGLSVNPSAIYDHLRSKEHPKEMWMQTKPVEVVSPTHVVYEIRPSERSLSWHYGFHGPNPQIQKSNTHFLEIGFFVERDGRFLCIGAAQTPHFRVASSRTWAKES